MNGDKEISFTAIAAGDYFTLALDNFGRVWATGLASHGQLGRNARSFEVEVTHEVTTPEGTTMVTETVTYDYSPEWALVVLEDGTPLGTNLLSKKYFDETTGTYQYYNETDPVTAIAAGANHALALTQSGFVSVSYTHLDVYKRQNQNNVGIINRVGDDIDRYLIFNKVWVYTDDVDEDTGAVLSTTLSARYANQLGVYQETDPNRCV